MRFIHFVRPDPFWMSSDDVWCATLLYFSAALPARRPFQPPLVKTPRSSTQCRTSAPIKQPPTRPRSPCSLLIRSSIVDIAGPLAGNLPWHQVITSLIQRSPDFEGDLRDILIVFNVNLEGGEAGLPGRYGWSGIPTGQNHRCAQVIQCFSICPFACDKSSL